MTKRRKKSTSQAQAGIDRRLLWLLGLAAIVVIVLGVVISTQGDSDVVEEAFWENASPEVSVDQAVQLRYQGAFILDVREPSEWDDFHIPDSTLIPLGELPSRLSEVPQDQGIVVVCRSGNRSQQGRDILEAAGFSQVTSMSGGVSAWRDAGYPIE